MLNTTAALSTAAMMSTNTTAAISTTAMMTTNTTAAIGTTAVLSTTAVTSASRRWNSRPLRRVPVTCTR